MLQHLAHISMLSMKRQGDEDRIGPVQAVVVLVKFALTRFELVRQTYHGAKCHESNWIIVAKGMAEQEIEHWISFENE